MRLRSASVTRRTDCGHVTAMVASTVATEPSTEARTAASASGRASPTEMPSSRRGAAAAPSTWVAA